MQYNGNLFYVFLSFGFSFFLLSLSIYCLFYLSLFLPRRDFCNLISSFFYLLPRIVFFNLHLHFDSLVLLFFDCLFFLSLPGYFSISFSSFIFFISLSGTLSLSLPISAPLSSSASLHLFNHFLPLNFFIYLQIRCNSAWIIYFSGNPFFYI